MAHFAKLDDNNVVIEVCVVSNEVLEDLPYPQSEAKGIVFLSQWSNGHTNWKQTSYNRNFRKNFAGIGFTYDANYDAFIPPKPDNNCTLDTDTFTWNLIVDVVDNTQQIELSSSSGTIYSTGA